MALGSLGRFDILFSCSRIHLPTFVKIENRYSPLVAVLLTLLALVLGVMNLLAALHNLGVAELYTERSILLIDLGNFSIAL